MIGNDLEMEKQLLVEPLQKKIENACAKARVEIEGAIDELEVAYATPIQCLQLLKKLLDGKRLGGLVQ